MGLRTTAIESLGATLREQWRAQPDEGVNRVTATPVARLFRTSRGERDLPALLAAVFSAADTSG